MLRWVLVSANIIEFKAFLVNFCCFGGLLVINFLHPALFFVFRGLFWVRSEEI